MAWDRAGIGPLSRFAPISVGWTAASAAGESSEPTCTGRRAVQCRAESGGQPSGGHPYRDPDQRYHCGELNLIGGSEARVDFVYTRRAPAVCPRPAGRLTRADLPVHHRSCRSTTVPASGVTCGLCGRTECTERLLVAAEYPATTVYLECSGPCGGSTAPMWAPVDAA
ncbi:hypothetical protein [Nocardia rhamnosiphila]|nr:hypothetical protein [Nocardia rhamnosiphila]